jgi:hypothetical protein
MKKLFLVLMFLSPSAHALEPFALQCSGELGGASFKSDGKGIVFSVDKPGLHDSGYVFESAENGGHWQQASSSIIEPSYDKGKKWLSVSVLKGHLRWVPAHTVCMPTRVIDKCVIRHVDGAYDRPVDTWYTLMVDITDGNPKFMSLDVFEPGFAEIGANVNCTLEK